MKIDLDTAWKYFQEMLFEESLDGFQKAKSKMMTLKNLLERFGKVDEDEMIYEIDIENLDQLKQKLNNNYYGLKKYGKEIIETLKKKEIK